MQSFTATGRWNGSQWVTSVQTPPYRGTLAYGHSRTEAKDAITDMMALLLGHRNFTVTVSFEEEVRG